MRPERGVFVSGARSDLQVETSARRLTPARLGSILREAETGSIFRQYEAFEQFEQDPKVFQCLSRRRKACVGKELQISSASDDALAQETASYCREQIDAIENWHEALFDLTDATGKAFSVGQNVWDFVGGRDVIVRIERWPQRDCTLGDPTRPRGQHDDEIRIITDANRNPGEPMASFQWVVHRHKARSSALAQASLLRVVAWFYLFKHFGIRDLMIFSEKFGQPLRLGKYSPGSQDEERNEIERAVINLGTDGAAVIPEGCSIELVEAKAATNNLPQPEIIKLCDGQIALAITGQQLTSEAGDRGARSLGEVHERVEKDLIIDDCAALARTIRRDVLSPMVYFNFGPEAPVPGCKFLIEEDEDLLSCAKKDQIVQKMGLEIGEVYMRSKYRIPKPGPGETIVRPPGGMS